MLFWPSKTTVRDPRTRPIAAQVYGPASVRWDLASNGIWSLSVYRILPERFDILLYHAAFYGVSLTRQRASPGPCHLLVGGGYTSLSTDGHIMNAYQRRLRE